MMSIEALRKKGSQRTVKRLVIIVDARASNSLLAALLAAIALANKVASWGSVLSLGDRLRSLDGKAIRFYNFRPMRQISRDDFAVKQAEDIMCDMSDQLLDNEATTGMPMNAIPSIGLKTVPVVLTGRGGG